jgi:hypothetical protein
MDPIAAALVFGGGGGDEAVLSNKTLVNPVIDGSIQEEVFTITDGAAFEVDPNNGSMQLITLTSSRTPKATNFVSGNAVLLMVDSAGFNLTWTDSTWGTSGVIWQTDSGSPPILSSTEYTGIVLWKMFTQVYGAKVGDV